MSDKIREGDPDLPRKKKSRPRDEDDDDERFERRRRKIARDEDDGSNSPLSAIVPIGVNIWALLSFYVSLLSCIPGVGLLAILFGAIAFFTHKQQASYGSITGNVRAVLGIVIGLLSLLFWVVILILALVQK